MIWHYHLSADGDVVLWLCTFGKFNKGVVNFVCRENPSPILHGAGYEVYRLLWEDIAKTWGRVRMFAHGRLRFAERTATISSPAESKFRPSPPRL
jgi:hypothetical protein